MKKFDYKKLALVGITSGLAIASPAIAANSLGHSEGIYLASGCGAGKCSHGANPKDRDQKNRYKEVADNEGYIQTDIQTVAPQTYDGDTQSANYKDSNVTQTPSKTYTK